jgi:fructose-1,6-bisphosphatase/inositol monophosphatase family enzyme/uridine kinase
MNSLDPERGLQSAVMAVRSGARLVRRCRHDPGASRVKPDGSTATDIDIASEEKVRQILHARHPGHGIVGEECPPAPGDETDYLWYVDPLDGTRVYAAGQDNCCVAATLTRAGVPLLAAVAVPFTGELYTAIRDRPSLLNGRPVRVGPARPLPDAEFLLYYDRGEPGLASLLNAAVKGELGRLTQLHGSFILSACRAARGSFDVFLAVKRSSGPLMPWDLAPAALMLAGAGGVLHDLEGRPLGGMVPARESVAGQAAMVAELAARFGPQVRDPRPFMAWARREERVFARLAGLIRGRESSRVIGVSGAGGGIGKSTFARELAALLGEADCRVIGLDDYLVPRVERDARNISAHDPAANDLQRAAREIRQLRDGAPCSKPVYDHERGRAVDSETIAPARYLILDGVHALGAEIRSLVDVAIYLDASAGVRSRRIRRDMEEKGVSEAYARSAHRRLEGEVRKHLLPLKGAADVVLEVDTGFSLKWVSPA